MCSFLAQNAADVKLKNNVPNTRILAQYSRDFSNGPLASGPLDTDQHGVRKEMEHGRIQTTVYFSQEGGDPAPFERMNDRILERLES